jgi:putative redox protein
MKTTVVWKDGMEFDGVSEQHQIRMDAKAPLGKNAGATPKELVALGLGGCTAMDVIALLKKHKQPPQSFRIDVEITPSSGSYPVVFDKALLTFAVDGAVDSEKLIEAVQLSQTKYCGVSAMLSKAFPIEYRIVLNGTEVGSGAAKF